MMIKLIALFFAPARDHMLAAGNSKKLNVNRRTRQ